MVKINIVILSAFILALSASGCFWVTTKSEGEEIKQDLQHMQDKLDKFEQDLKKERMHLTEMIGRARTEVEKLEETLNRATRVLSRNSADFGAEMESIKEKLRQIDGSLAELRHNAEQSDKALSEANSRVREFAVAAGIDLPVDAATVPKNPNDHLSMISSAYSEGRYSEVRSLGKVFLDRHASHDKADNVFVLIGKSYLAQKRWAKGLGILREFTERYPKSGLTPEVLYEMARAFFALGDCTDARILVDTVTSRYRRSPFATKSAQLGKQMNRERGRCTS